jgi:CRP-like cAMP-binding protein
MKQRMRAAPLPMRRAPRVLTLPARRWIGHRRTVGVRAITEVSAVVLSHDDMRWAVAHDYRMSHELAAALMSRRLTVARHMRAERKAAKATKTAAG